MSGKFVFLLFMISWSSFASLKEYYFSDDNTGNPRGDDANPCTESSPCRSLNKVQDILDAMASDDTVYLYFDRGDEWDASSPITNGAGSRITSWSSSQDAVIRTKRGTVFFDAYGEGNKPCFQGPVTSWSTDCFSGGGRHKTDNIISLQADGARIYNLEITGHFANGIGILSGSGKHIIRYCYFHQLGGGGLHNQGPGDAYGTSENIIEYNEVAYVQRAYEFGYQDLWGNAIGLEQPEGQYPVIWGNQVRYNYVHHSFGEGIASGSGRSPHDNGATPTIIEFNLIGDTRFTAIHCQPRYWDLGLAYIRHNLIFTTSEGRSYHGGPTGDKPYKGQGFFIMDEYDGGDNRNGEQHYYGNIIIGRERGMDICTGCEDGAAAAQYGKLYIYNNTFIDCDYPIWFKDKNDVADGRIFNNSYIMYDLSAQYVWDMDVATSSTWTIEYNHFFGGNETVPFPWDNSMVTGDPVLSKSSGWRDISGPPSFSDVIPQAGSVLIDAGLDPGSGFDSTALIPGTDFSTLPVNDSFVTTLRGVGSVWDIGAVETGSGSVNIKESLHRANRDAVINVSPNPFNPSTVITVSGIPAGVSPEFCIYDSRGRIAARPNIAAGAISGVRRSYIWDAAGMPAGVYMAVVETRLNGNSRHSFNKRMVLIK